ncbi:MAG: hypothetical protein WCY58_14090, partial [Mariniphaga sp.]
YFDHLGIELFGEVEAFFTDEPSMMAVNLGELAENVQKNVRVTDPPDPGKKNLPMISWSEDLPEKYKVKYGEELMPSIASLFAGDEEKDKAVRQKFWSLLAGLNKQYYYDAIRNWCQSMQEKSGGKGPVSTGHGLREEYPAIHVPLDGNKLAVAKGFDIPGLDQLNSNPSIWSGDAWMAALFPNSSFMLTGRRRVMCEMSDFVQTMGNKGPATIQQMQAASAWQMAFGVTDFALYYTISYGKKYPYRNKDEYKKYCDFISRINSLVMKATPVKKILLYYPIYDLQREYIPAAEKMSRNTQSEWSKIVESSFKSLGSNLLKAQNQFVLVDYLSMEGAVITNNQTIQIGRDQYTSIIFPRGVVFPPSVSEFVRQAENKGITIIFADDYEETPSSEKLTELTGNKNKLHPSSMDIAFGKFNREGREIYVLVNTGKEKYQGELALPGGKMYSELDPQAGTVSAPQKILESKIGLELNPMQTKLFTVL